MSAAGSAAAQQRASPSPAPATGGSPIIPAVASGAATNATAATNTTTEITDEAVGAADNDTTTEAPDTTTPAAEGLKPSPDKRIKGFYDSPKAAAERIPELKELNRLVTASPAVTKLLKDKDLVATIFAPNNEVSCNGWKQRGVHFTGLGLQCNTEYAYPLQSTCEPPWRKSLKRSVGHV